jgi:hypothetical protein
VDEEKGGDSEIGDVRFLEFFLGMVGEGRKEGREGSLIFFWSFGF